MGRPVRVTVMTARMHLQVLPPWSPPTHTPHTPAWHRHPPHNLHYPHTHSLTPNPLHTIMHAPLQVPTAYIPCIHPISDTRTPAPDPMPVPTTFTPCTLHPAPHAPYTLLPMHPTPCTPCTYTLHSTHPGYTLHSMRPTRCRCRPQLSHARWGCQPRTARATTLVRM